MNKYSCSLKVYFESPFWVMVFEKVEGEKLFATKITVGAEPTDATVLDFVLKFYQNLKFGPSVDVSVKDEIKNPKRRQREIKKFCKNIQKGTKSQEAVKLLYEESKNISRKKIREKRQMLQKKNYLIKKQKAKEKHRGR